MAEKNKAFVCFDPDNDLHCWNVLKSWNTEGLMSFKIEKAREFNQLYDDVPEATLKKKIKEVLRGMKVLIILIGNHPRNLLKYSKPEIEFALENDIPIIGVNLNTGRKQDDLCPQILKNELVMFIAFGQKILEVAYNNWPESYFLYKEDGKSGPYHYYDSVYAELRYQVA